MAVPLAGVAGAATDGMLDVDGAAEPDVPAVEFAAPAAAAEAAPAAAPAAASEAGAGVAAGAGAGAGIAAGAGAGSCFLPQAVTAAAAIRVAKTSDFFISSFLLWIEQLLEMSAPPEWPL
ncbi:MAG: hypothetical protein H0X13_17010 [Ramlibacter sp.]|nr:hypothetical protein [Ramlibacter sp.]